MNIKEMLKDHKWNVFGAFTGLVSFFIAVTELNNLCAPYIWADLHQREIWSFWTWKLWLESGAWYNMMFLLLGISLVIVSFSLWFWYDEPTAKA